MTDNLAFYCPVHQVRFHAAANEVIQCERNAHTLGSGFPHQSWWMYCCDCATFAPYAPVDRNKGLRECLVCERQTAKRYLCNECRVLSVESNVLVRRKDFSINGTAVRPNCPGCGLESGNAAAEHECAEAGITFLTAAAVCEFCNVSRAGSKIIVDERIFCGGCGTEFQSGFNFCKRCGKPRPKSEERVEQPALAVADVLDVPDESFEDTEEDDWDQDDTGELELPASRPWDFPQPPPTRNRRNPWFIAGGVALVAVAILVTVMSLGGNRSKVPRPAPSPKPTTLPTYPGMVYLPGGEFTMGSNAGDEYERPAHKVRVAPFFIDVNEVTCDDYLQFVKATGHQPPRSWTNGSYTPGDAKKPVTGVDWNDANAYASWAKKRLPTEEEWEFAARGTSGGEYPWGDEWRPNAANAGESSAHALADVGSYSSGKTPAGVMDLIGNAWEWTSSDVVPYPGGHFSEAPPEGVKIIRGGSWQGNKQQATSTYRGFLQTSGAKDYSATGFRCVKDQ